MGKMKELFIELQEENEDRAMYYGITPSSDTCPNCLETRMIEQTVDQYFECLYCGHMLIKHRDGSYQIT
jgi:uncharacterized protein (DUF983 family)